MKFTNFMEPFRSFFAKFWPFLPFFKNVEKRSIFIFFEKPKKYIGDYLVIKGLHSPQFWKPDFESVTALDARSLLFYILFSIWPPIFFFKKFFVVDPKYTCMPKMKFLGIKLRKKPFGTVPSP